MACKMILNCKKKARKKHLLMRRSISAFNVLISIYTTQLMKERLSLCFYIILNEIKIASKNIIEYITLVIIIFLLE